VLVPLLPPPTGRCRPRQYPLRGLHELGVGILTARTGSRPDLKSLAAAEECAEHVRVDNDRRPRTAGHAL
jgi:hypothetical protein